MNIYSAALPEEVPCESCQKLTRGSIVIDSDGEHYIRKHPWCVRRDLEAAI